ncbi:hypothetical protein IE990_03210 [Klebsiella pneumoniae]|uniref:Uncharacterized protein n=1 Tax=Klebsiella pneumoniae TaxID=573 RepID=A0A927DCX9_KLEPN|nr:hypothetical protein [Klebsiella pneumoniae]MBD3704036.1 hypothetical protein [Klebsiella pneumoniae]
MNKRINELQVALSAATAEKEALIKKAGVVQNNNLQQSRGRGASADPAINDADSASRS